MATCLPCGHTVDEHTVPRFEYKDMTFYFCSPGCEARVKADPEKWLLVAKSPDATEGHGGAHAH